MAEEKQTKQRLTDDEKLDKILNELTLGFTSKNIEEAVEYAATLLNEKGNGKTNRNKYNLDTIIKLTYEKFGLNYNIALAKRKAAELKTKMIKAEQKAAKKHTTQETEK